MITGKVLKQIEELPGEYQREVVDFIQFLRSRHGRAGHRTPRRGAISDERFIGMWKGRGELGDSTAWLRNLRESEWRSDR